jgi:hypothetical protein
VNCRTTGKSKSRKLPARSSLAIGAGIGLFAAAPAEAEVVPFTPAGAPITLFQSANYHFDINGDGTNDFAIFDPGDRDFKLSDYFGAFGYFGSNMVKNVGPYAAIVPAGSTVGPDTKGWLNEADLDLFAGKRAYAGVVFDIPGSSPHFGYLDISMPADATSVTLYGGAYESVANTPINVPNVPEPNALVLLASGAAGLAAWRRRGGRTASASTG